MESIAQGSGIFRTALLAKEAALRFARCLDANRQYTNVEVAESQTAKDPVRRWYVRWLPTDTRREEAILARKQGERHARAEDEGPLYTWVQDTDAPFWHLLVPNGNVYEVDDHGRACSCPDHTYRCRQAGLRCKHLVAWDLSLGTYIIPDEADVYGRREECGIAA